jgi:hypothetical protein
MRVMGVKTLAAMTVLLGGLCFAKKQPPDPKFLAIGELSVLPLVDARAGKKADINLAHVQEAVVKALTRKHYPATAASSNGDAGQIAEEDLAGAQSTFVKKLGPAEMRWVFVFCLEDVASKITFGSTGNAEMSGYLFDKDSGELLWSGKGVGKAGQGGLLGMAMKGAMNGAAVDEAISDLMRQIPDRPKPEKKKGG